MSFDCEKHGKGPCDGHGGTMKFWMSDAAKKTEILDADGLAAVLRAASFAAQTAASPTYVFKVFSPPALDTFDMQMFCPAWMAGQQHWISRYYYWTGLGARQTLVHLMATGSAALVRS